MSAPKILSEVDVDTWYVARTKVNSESKAARNLENQGFVAYLPCYRKTIRHARKVSKVRRPLFPGYVFICVSDDNPTLHAIRSTIGVIHLIQFGTAPQPVPQEVIDLIKAREDDEGVVRLLPDNPMRGSKVRVVDGCFTGHTALLEDVSDNSRVVLLLNFMGQAVRARVPAENLAMAL